MAKISAYSPAAGLSGAELIPMVQSGVTVKGTAQDIANLGAGGLVFASYAAMQAYAGTLSNKQQVRLSGYYDIVNPKGNGIFVCNTGDTTTPDDGGVTCVTAASQRLTRILDDHVTPEMFGAIGDVITRGIDQAADDAPAIRRWCDFLNSTSNQISRGIAPQFYRLASLDSRVSNRYCFTFTKPGLVIEGAPMWYNTNVATFSYFDGSNTGNCECLVEIPGDSLSIKDIGFKVWSFGSGSLTIAVVHISYSNFPAGFHFENMWVSASNTPYGLYGQFWGSLIEGCAFIGGSIAPFNLVSGTNNHISRCYSNGLLGSQYCWMLAGWYSKASALGADNIAVDGCCYLFIDREWEAAALGCESSQAGGRVIEAVCTNLIIDGVSRESGANSIVPIWIHNGCTARINGANIQSSTTTGKVAQLALNSSLVTDIPMSAIDIVANNQLGGGDPAIQSTLYLNDRVTTIAGGGTAPNLPIATYPYPPLTGAGGRDSGIGFHEIHHTEWAASTPKALGAYILVTTSPTVILECTTAGTTKSGSPPSFNFTIGGTTSDGSVVWTARVKSADSIGPITNWGGVGYDGVTGYSTQTRQAFVFTAPLVLSNIELDWFFNFIDFYFDYADATNDAFSLHNVRSVRFHNCTFNFRSAARCVFGGSDTNNLTVNARVTIDPDCKLIGGGFLVGSSGSYWRGPNLAPSAIIPSYNQPTLMFDEIKWPVLPTATLWDGNIDLHLEAPDANGYMSRHLTRTGWIPHYTWSTGKTVVSGDTTIPTVDNGHYYTAGGAGTTHASVEPSWPTGAGATVTDNGITWTESGTSALVKRYDLLA